MSKISWMRRLSPAEDLFWRPDAVCPLNTIGSIVVDGELDPQRLQQALDLVQQRHPLLQARVLLRWNKPWFAHGAARIPLQQREVAPEQFRAFEWAEAARVFDSASGPLLRVTLVRLGPQQQAIVLALHHAIFDGRSGVLFVHDLLRAYAEPETPMEPLPEKDSFYSVLPEDCRGWAGYRQYKTQQQALMTELAGITGDLKVNNETPIEQRHKVFDFLFLDRETTRALTSRARREKTTMHAILAVVLARAIARDLAMDAARFAIISPTDICTKLPVKYDQDMVLATSAVTCAIAVSEAENPWDSARTFRASLQKFTRDRQYLALGPMMMKIFSRMAWWMSLGKNGGVRLVRAFNKASGFALSYTSMGDMGIAPEQPGFVIRRVYCMPGYTTNSPLISLSSMFNGELVWAFGGFHEQIGEARLRRLMAACEVGVHEVLAGTAGEA